jgi:hypothetical protein
VKSYTSSDYAGRLDQEVEKGSGNGSPLTVNVQADTKQPNSKTRKAESPQIVPRRSTGPRTQQGKERSKRNSITHGIFSNVVLKSESQADFDALLNALYTDRRPKGALEEVLVNRLAGLFWRLRRVGAAEVAEIRTGAEFLQWDENERNRQDASRLSQLSCNGGLTWWVGNPEALQGCLDLLEDLKESIAEGGFDPEYDKAILTKLYGGYEEGHESWKKTLFDSYLAWQGTSLCSDEERQQKGYLSPQKCTENFLEEVKEEIQRLERYRKEHATISACKFELESLRRRVPDGSQLDRLLRYEAALSREIERTLNQLERLQRARLGQGVPPSINLNVTTSRDHKTGRRK